MNEIQNASWSQFEGIPDYVTAAHNRGDIAASEMFDSERNVNFGDYVPYDQFVENALAHPSTEPGPYSLATSALARFGLVETAARHAKPRAAETSVDIPHTPELTAEPVIALN